MNCTQKDQRRELKKKKKNWISFDFQLLKFERLEIANPFFPSFCTSLHTVCSVHPIHLLAVIFHRALASVFAFLPAWSWCFNPGFNPWGYGTLQTPDSWSMTRPAFNPHPPHEPWAVQDPSVVRLSNTRSCETATAPRPSCPIPKRGVWWIW